MTAPSCISHLKGFAILVRIACQLSHHGNFNPQILPFKRRVGGYSLNYYFLFPSYKSNLGMHEEINNQQSIQRVVVCLIIGLIVLAALLLWCRGANSSFNGRKRECIWLSRHRLQTDGLCQKPEAWSPHSHVPAYGFTSLWGDPSKPETHLVGGCVWGGGGARDS